MLEVMAQKLDMENGFRWLIERNSLEVRIAQELEFDRRATEGEVRTPERMSSTGPDTGSGFAPQEPTLAKSAPMDDMSRQGRVDTVPPAGFEADASIVEFLKKQIEFLARFNRCGLHREYWSAGKAGTRLFLSSCSSLAVAKPQRVTYSIGCNGWRHYEPAKSVPNAHQVSAQVPEFAGVAQW